MVNLAYLIVSFFMLFKVSSSSVGLFMSRSLVNSSSMVGSFESSVPIVCFSVLCLSSVFQSGIIVRMELYSSSIFILDLKRASDSSSEGVFFRES